MKITQHLLISGRVQGVSFRFFTQKCALVLGLTGWVRNLSDGRVEVLVQGEKAKLDQMSARLAKGPARAQVSDLEVELVVQYEDMKEFNIEPDGEDPWLSK